MRIAIVTASYRGDFERCRLLCDSIDARVSGHTRHVILVEAADVALFRRLAGPRREIVSERDLLPAWLRPFPDPSSGGRRRLWLSPFGPPLRGWHVQQLRRIAFAHAMPEEAMLSLDSDTAFVRPFNVGSLVTDGALAFYRRPQGMAEVDPSLLAEHGRWVARADALLGIAAGTPAEAGYIATGIAWRRDSVRDMAARIEVVRGRSLMRALAASRALSECTLYGRFVDEAENRPDRHRPTETPVCRVLWLGQAPGAGDLARMVAGLEPAQAALGIQSFIGADPALIRRAAGLA